MTIREAPAQRLAGAVAGLLSLALAAGCSSGTSIDPPTASDGGSEDRTAAASVAVSHLQSALRDGDASAARESTTGPARASLAAAMTNVRDLRITELALRFIDDNAISADDLVAFGPDAWRGTVEVRYRIEGWDQETVRVETPVVFVPGETGARVASIGGEDGRTPLWLRGRVAAHVVGRALVLLRPGAATRYVALARRALSDVGRVLPTWKGSLVLEVPATEEELDQALDATQEQYANIAAVTAAVDGSLVPGSPVHVFVNPRVFEGLGPRGAQVVISHESTHVATGATFAEMPVWLLEGFADYVALAHAGIPVATAGSQILARVRRHGAPDHLPTPAELDPTATGLGATYEEAWLANRFLARTYGEHDLVAFYRAVDAGATAETAFNDVLGTTEAAFVTRWRADLVALAGGEPG